MSMSPEELRATIEAILFVSGEPVSIDRLKEALPGEAREAIAAELENIRAHFDDHVGGFGLEEAGGGFRFASRPAHDSVIRKFFAKQGEGRLSLAALETLAIIAYRQPITAPEISDIRGVNTSGVLRTLLDRRMIRIAGRKAVVGSPFLYRTTREFLMHFGLNSVQDLPRLEEFADLLGENVGEEFLADLSIEGRSDSSEAEGQSADAEGEPPAETGESEVESPDGNALSTDSEAASDPDEELDEESEQASVPLVEDETESVEDELTGSDSVPSDEASTAEDAGSDAEDDAMFGEGDADSGTDADEDTEASADEFEEDRAGSRERQ